MWEKSLQVNENKSVPKTPLVGTRISPSTDIQSRSELIAALDRCDREQAEIQARPDVLAGKAPAWLVTLGIFDWEFEKQLLFDRFGHLL